MLRSEPAASRPRRRPPLPSWTKHGSSMGGLVDAVGKIGEIAVQPVEREGEAKHAAGGGEIHRADQSRVAQLAETGFEFGIGRSAIGTVGGGAAMRASRTVKGTWER